MQEFICDQDFVDIDYSVVKLHKGTFDNVVFKNCLFNRLALNQFVFIDCSFIECDLSLISVKEATFRNVTFSRCKVIGVQFFHCNNIGLDLHFSECLLDHSSFYAKTMKGSTFTSCSLKNVDFTATNLSKGSVIHCDLEEAKFEQSILLNTSFEHSMNYAIDPTINQIKGAIFSMPEAMSLLDCFQISIK